ncbi:MAG: hypothetical protein DRI36_04695 [Caldiserica bacterium]|nr:MAG: hypothetical protein DRI36_04695 [Caldisericota bacterium]
MRKSKLYLDTSVISAYFDKRKKERQVITKRWFRFSFARYHIFISEIVLFEINATKDNYLKKRMKSFVKDYPVLEVNKEIRYLAEIYTNEIFSEKNYRDALHVAVASYYDMDAIVSWNFAHLVNFETKRMVRSINLANGYREIDILSPLEFMGEI